MAEMKTFNGFEVVDAKARQNIEAHNTRITEVEKFFEAADANGVIDKLVEVQKYIEDDAQAAASLIQSIADVDAKVDAIELPTKVSELENDANYTDKAYVDTAVKNVEVDLTGYATETYVTEQIDAIEFPVTDISGKSDVGHKHTLNEITDYKEPHIPTRVSELDNDKNYLTEHQSLEAYATKTFVNNAVANVEVDLSGYATETFVNNKTSALSSDLTSYVHSVLPRKVSQLQNDAEYLTAVPEEYVTETELEDKDYATESFVADVLSNIEGGVAFSDDGNGNVLISPATADSYVNDFSNYYTKAETSALIDMAISNIEVPEIPEPDLTGYATEQFVLDKVAEIEIPDISNLASKDEIPDVSNFATEQFVTDTVNAIEHTTLVTHTETSINISSTKAFENHAYSNPVTAINGITTTSVDGMAIQFKTGASCTVSGGNWIGDDCKDNVFTPVANTYYEVYCYHNKIKNTAINMVMNLGA